MAVSVLDRMRSERGHFVFESGLHGDLWLDLDDFFARPDRVTPLLDDLAERLRPIGADVVVGPCTGGALVAYGVAERLGLRFVGAERVETPADGVGYRLAASRDLRGRGAVVVDDAINAGSATGATLRALAEHGVRPVGIAAFLVLGGGAARMAERVGVPLVALAEETISTWPPQDCPLCADRCPVTRQ
ncbi:orotate phosphoribosyltransferase [Pseudonocardia phyllosphaerae]|uniref:orotate phosphoribosyltransferase n=1 Tax=Pseudonocardia phyllosphaerae TaxID=3390502 RepID=UPI00397DB5A1